MFAGLVVAGVEPKPKLPNIDAVESTTAADVVVGVLVVAVLVAAPLSGVFASTSSGFAVVPPNTLAVGGLERFRGAFADGLTTMTGPEGTVLVVTVVMDAVQEGIANEKLAAELVPTDVTELCTGKMLTAGIGF